MLVEVTLLFVYPYMCFCFQLLDQLTDVHETWYELYDIQTQPHPNISIISLIKFIYLSA